jgi:hypothetical protein
LIPTALVKLAPGKSIVVKVASSAETPDAAPSAKLSVNRYLFHCVLSRLMHTN